MFAADLYGSDIGALPDRMLLKAVSRIKRGDGRRDSGEFTCGKGHV